MTGTRLLIHTTFIVQLFLLIITSCFYAINKKLGDFSSTEPFVIDRSGWQSVVEDVSPVDSGGCARVRNVGNYLLQSVERLMHGKVAPSTRSKPSAFVEEMRNKISQLKLTPNGSLEENLLLPPLKFQITVPQISDHTSDKVNSMANALERGFQKYSTLQVKQSATSSDAITSSSCDDYAMPERDRYEPQMLQIILLTGCDVPGDIEASLEIGRYSPTITIRTKYTLSGHEATHQLETLLEDDIASIISNELLRTSKISSRRLESISIELVDENSAKLAFESIGQAFASSVDLLVQPLLSDLSLLYGGLVRIEEEDSNYSVMKTSEYIGLTTQVSSYLHLPDEMIETDAAVGDNVIPTKYISTEEIAKWADSRLSKHAVKQGDNVNWVLFVPSQDHSQLVIRNKSAGGEGTSITFARHVSNGKAIENGALSGLSLVNLDPSYYSKHIGNGDVKVQRATSSAMLYLVDYIRAFHGLPPVEDQRRNSSSNVSVSYFPPIGAQQITYWELESISRNHWHASLEEALSQTENIMSLLYTRYGLAFPTRLAQRLNNATRLLRDSISLSEKGHLTQYATSGLYASLNHLESIMSDPELMEPPHFAIDHYLAVFSPLILPLLMPLIVGLVREIKRYRKLRGCMQ